MPQKCGINQPVPKNTNVCLVCESLITHLNPNPIGFGNATHDPLCARAIGLFWVVRVRRATGVSRTSHTSNFAFPCAIAHCGVRRANRTCPCDRTQNLKFPCKKSPVRRTTFVRSHKKVCDRTPHRPRATHGLPCDWKTLSCGAARSNVRRTEEISHVRQSVRFKIQ